MINRLICAVLTALLVLSTSPTTTAAAGPSDLEGHWARAHVESAILSGYVNGFPDGTFRPDQSITRAEFFKLLSAALQHPPQPGGWSEFTAQSHWSFQQGHIQAAVRAGLLVPPDYGSTLGPDQPIRRREMVLATVRALGKAGLVNEQTPALGTPDAGAYPTWLQGWAAMAVESGILTGYPDGSLGLERGATRAEALTMVRRILDHVTVTIAPATAPTNETARRYPGSGSTDWWVIDPWAMQLVITDGTHNYPLPAGARGLELLPAPGATAWVRYTVDGDTPEIMFDVIARLDQGTITEAFRHQFKGEFRNLVGVSPTGEAWFTDGARVMRADADAQTSLIATTSTEISSGEFAPDGSFWGLQWEQNQILRVSPTGEVTAIQTGLTQGEWMQHLSLAPDGSVWLIVLLADQTRTDLIQFRDGTQVRRFTAISHYMAGNDPLPVFPFGRAGDDLWIARQNQTGATEFATTGYFRLDLNTGAFTSLVTAQTGSEYSMTAAPDGGAMLKDQNGAWWRIEL